MQLLQQMQLVGAASFYTEGSHCRMASCMCVPKKKTSTLSSLEALEVVGGLHEWMHRSSLEDRAVRLPFLVFLLTLGAVGLAHTVNGHVPSTHLVDAMQVHASLSEQIFTPRLSAEIFLTPQVVQ